MGHGGQISRGDVADRAPEKPETLEALFLAYNTRLRRLLGRRGARPGSIDDLVHETLIRAADSMALFDRSKPLWPWLRTIAINTMIADARKHCREVCLEDLDSLIGSAPEEPCDDGYLDEALAAVPRRQRVALSLRYLDDWSPLEAASFMGISRSCFDQLLSRGRRKLRIEYQRLRTRGHLVLLFPAHWARRITADARGHPLITNAGPTTDVVTQMAAAAAAAIIIIAAGPPAPSAHASSWHENFVQTDQRVRPKDPGKRKPGGDTRAAPSRDGSGPPVEETGPVAGPASAPLAPADDITDPNRSVKEPEDAEIGSIAFADDKNHTAYAAGQASCATAYCPPVLFVSADGGRTWERLPAFGLQGTLIAVPPGHDKNRTIFAMSPGGLQVSHDGGLSFLSLTPTGLSPATGSIAVSPLYDRGDALVLVGAQTLMRYSDTSGVIDPYAGSFHGPFEPAFSSSYPADPLFYLGTMRADGIGGLRATAFTCHSIGCTYTSLPSLDRLPKVRTAPYAGGEHVYAFTENDLFVSAAGRNLHFQRLATPSTEGDLLDLRTFGKEDALIAAVGGAEGSLDHGIYTSFDDGRSWLRSHLPGNLGTRWIAVSEDRILAALTGRGLVCSDNGGRSFHRRCAL